METHAPTIEQMRIRRILDSLTRPRRDALKKLLPKGVYADKTMKTWPNVKYPTGLLHSLPDGEAYGLLGHIAEEMLGQASNTINLDTLIVITKKWYPEMTAKEEAKVRKSTPTPPFIERLKNTRLKLEAVFDGPTQYEPTVASGCVQGHPDITTPTQVFEIKLTGQLKENWGDFVFQAFSYAALLPACRQVHIVLPLQEHIWTCDVSAWINREAYLAALKEASTHYQTTAAKNKIAADEICNCHNIGSHINRKGSFCNSIAHIKDGSRAWQLFLGSNMSSRINIKDEDIAATKAHIQATGARIFIHSPYIINLCATPGQDDDYHTGCLATTARIAAQMGCRGVVVHVGKMTDKEPTIAMENFRINLRTAMEAATPECPILLETPAGQGSETLRTREEFVSFVASFNDSRLRICIDTCHVFTCGHDPLTYINETLVQNSELLQLIHYNDSESKCGACLDRHAYMGLGEIGIDTMRAIAEAATKVNIPCVIE